MEPVTLRTERLELSVPTAADADAIFEACQDELIQRYTMVPAPYERSHATGFVELAAQWWDAGTETTWAIRRGSDLVGMIGIHGLGRGHGELGYWVAPGSRGHGYVIEGARAVIDWAFAHDGLELARLEWRAVAGNVISGRVGRALGFRYEGLLRRGLVSRRGHEDGWIAGLLPEDDRTPQPWPVLDD